MKALRIVAVAVLAAAVYAVAALPPRHVLEIVFSDRYGGESE